jgi:putative membrane protein
VPRQLFGRWRSDRSSKLIGGLRSKTTAGFRSRRRDSHDRTSVAAHDATFPTRRLNILLIALFVVGTFVFVIQNFEIVTLSFLAFGARTRLGFFVAILYVLGMVTGGDLFALLRRSIAGSGIQHDPHSSPRAKRPRSHNWSRYYPQQWQYCLALFYAQNAWRRTESHSGWFANQQESRMFDRYGTGVSLFLFLGPPAEPVVFRLGGLDMSPRAVATETFIRHMVCVTSAGLAESPRRSLRNPACPQSGLRCPFRRSIHACFRHKQVPGVRLAHANK